MKTIDIVFDGPPGHDAGRFVEVEQPDGKSISLGEWLKRDDGYWVLRMPDPRPLADDVPVCSGERPPDGEFVATEHGRLLSAAWALIADAHGVDFKFSTDEWQVAATRWRDEWNAYSRKAVRVALGKCTLCGSTDQVSTTCLACSARSANALRQLLEMKPTRIADLQAAPIVGLVVSHPTRGRGLVTASDLSEKFTVLFVTGERASYSLRRSNRAGVDVEFHDGKAAGNGKAEA